MNGPSVMAARPESHAAGEPNVGGQISSESFSVAKNLSRGERVVLGRDGRLHRTEFHVPIAKSRGDGLSAAELSDKAFLTSAQWPVVAGAGRAVRIADLFSGCGIMSLGVWEACRAIGHEMEIAMAVDANAKALKVLEANFPHSKTTNELIEVLLNGRVGTKPTERERAFVREVGNLDLLIGGPPCQGHSDLNNHTRRNDPKNALYGHMARAAELLRPTHIILENVSAVQHDHNRVVERTATALRKIGYEVDDGLIEASQLGVPQRRKRHILVASLLHTPRLKDVRESYYRDERPMWWAIQDLQKVKTDRVFDYAGATTEINKQRIDYLFDHNTHELPDKRRPDCHRLAIHSYRSAYGRMYSDRPAQTITTGFSSIGQGRFIHPFERRTITPHEAARLQFIPDFFRFDGINRTSLCEMIGNAVPTKLAYVLALELLR